MKFRTARDAAILTSFSAVAILVAILLGGRYFESRLDSMWIDVILVATVFIGVFFVTGWAIDRFIHEKIKVIYRIIQGRVEGDQSHKPGLEEVQHQAEDWAVKRQSEIQNLKEQAQFRREFIGNLAHELRTPLFSIQGYIDTLLEGGIEDEKINYDYLRRADKNLERLTALVKDLNEISNIESGRVKMNMVKFNIVELAEEALGMAEFRAKKKKIEIGFSKANEKPIMVKADRDKIVQVLTNLVINAIHYGRGKGKL